MLISRSSDIEEKLSNYNAPTDKYKLLVCRDLISKIENNFKAGEENEEAKEDTKLIYSIEKTLIKKIGITEEANLDEKDIIEEANFYIYLNKFSCFPGLTDIDQSSNLLFKTRFYVDKAIDKGVIKDYVKKCNLTQYNSLKVLGYYKDVSKENQTIPTGTNQLTRGKFSNRKKRNRK